GYVAPRSIALVTSLSPSSKAARRSSDLASPTSLPTRSVSDVFLPLSTCLAIQRTIALRLASASRWPRPPQPHFGPPALTVMCPSSPAELVAPVSTSPPITIPPPIPVPGQSATQSRQPRPAPAAPSAITATRT